MQFNFDPIKPYLALIKGALCAIVASVLFVGGCNYGENLSAKKIADKDVALGHAAASLRAGADALRKVNAEAERRKQEAERQRRAAEIAAEVAEDARKQLDERTRAFQEQLKQARRKPQCAALLDTDVERICEL